MSMRFAVMGTGGVGGYFGARLAATGADVTFIARGEHLKAIRADGLRVLSPLGEMHIAAAQATDDVAEIGAVDAVLFAVKLYDVEEAGTAIKPLVDPDTVVLSLQNGVDAEERLIPILGKGPVMGGIAYIFAGIESPGVIRHGGPLAKIVLGELDGRPSPRAKALLESLADAGIEARISDDIAADLWSKFVLLAAVSAVTSLARLPVGPMREDPEARALLAAAMAEVVSVAVAKGIAVPSDIIKTQLALVDGLGHQAKPSMLQDLERGARLEVASLSGLVARMGRELGIDTPIHRTVYAALKLHASGR
jgi:2-dehydropantoate 2-reductase